MRGIHGVVTILISPISVLIHAHALWFIRELVVGIVALPVEVIRAVRAVWPAPNLSHSQDILCKREHDLGATENNAKNAHQTELLVLYLVANKGYSIRKKIRIKLWYNLILLCSTSSPADKISGRLWRRIKNRRRQIRWYDLNNNESTTLLTFTIWNITMLKNEPFLSSRRFKKGCFFEKSQFLFFY